jgi:hypothetical protein
MEEEFETGIVTKSHLKYPVYNIKNNLQVVFEDGDVSVRKII